MMRPAWEGTQPVFLHAFKAGMPDETIFENHVGRALLPVAPNGGVGQEWPTYVKTQNALVVGPANRSLAHWDRLRSTVGRIPPLR